MDAKPTRFVVCGLGGLGQHCIAMLREFGVEVDGVDREPPREEEVPRFRGMLGRLVVGDCRDLDVLRQAGVHEARGMLVVTADERANVETAFAARRVNPTIRLVVRCSRENLNALLAAQLDDFVAFEPTELAAPAFALAATEAAVVGLFRLRGRVVRVVERELDLDDVGLVGRAPHQLDATARRVVLRRAVRAPARLEPPEGRWDVPFHDHDPEAPLAAGERIVAVELGDTRSSLAARPGDEPPPGAPAAAPRRGLPRLDLPAVRRRLAHFLSPSYPHRVERVAVLVGATVAAMLGVGAIVLAAGLGLGGADALFTAVVLLLGGYADRFDDLAAGAPPVWLRGYALALTVAGTALVGVVYAMVTEKLLTMRLGFLVRRPPMPTEGHVVIVGLGGVGRRVARSLRELAIPCCGVTASGIDADALPWLPVAAGRSERDLERVNLERARGLVVVTSDDMDNLETALLAHARVPSLRLVIRVADARFGENVSTLLPYANVLSTTALAAEVFAAAAFGEQVSSLFRLEGRSVMVTEYEVEEGDTLDGLQVGEVAYGYGVVPLLFERGAGDHDRPSIGLELGEGEGRQRFLPPDEQPLRAGDRLVVLATSQALRRIERRERERGGWRLHVQSTLGPDAVLAGAAEISRRTGCGIRAARALLDDLPAELDHPLHRRPALDLVRALRRLQVLAEARPAPGACDAPAAGA